MIEVKAKNYHFVPTVLARTPTSALPGSMIVWPACCSVSHLCCTGAPIQLVRLIPRSRHSSGDDILCLRGLFLSVHSLPPPFNHSTETWPGIKEPGGRSTWRSGTDPAAPSTCSTRTPSASSYWAFSSISSGAQTTSGTGSLASWPPSWWSWSGNSLETPLSSWRESRTTQAHLENTTVCGATTTKWGGVTTVYCRRLHSEYFGRHSLLLHWLHPWHSLRCDRAVVAQHRLDYHLWGERWIYFKL